MQALGRDLKAFTRSEYTLAKTDVTAAGSGDATAINGSTIDLQGKPKAESVVFEIPLYADLDNAETLAVTGIVQESPNGSDWTTLVASATLATLTGDAVSGGSTETGIARLGANLNQALSTTRYIRCVITPDLSRSGIDTAVIGAGVAVFGGLQEVPQTS